MEFQNGTPHAMENSFQIQGSWIPITPPKPEQIQGSWMPVIPSKPEQTNRTTSTQWLNPGACSNGLIQENTCQIPVAPSYSTSATTQFNSAALVDQVPGNNNWRAALAAQTQVSSLNSYEVALRNAEARWNKTPNTHILGTTDTSAPTAAQKGSNVARMQPPISYSQIDGSSNGQQQSYLAKNLSNINQALLQGLNPSSSKNTICLPGMPQYGFPFPYHATSDCNTTLKTNADVVSNGTIQFQTVPVTPDWGMKAKTSQTVENEAPLANSRTSREREHDNSLQPSVSITALAKGSIHPCNNGILLQSTIDSMRANIPSPPFQEIPNHSKISFPNTLSTPMKETHNPNKVEENHIDLNKTPQQKPKRKKHRPKVIKEDKDKRTPKAVTPNQAVNKENPGGKRKYVRTASSKVSVTISANATKTVDSDSRMRKRSCRRALNFNQEDKAGGGNPKMVQVHQNIQSNSNGVNSSVASYTRAFSLEAMAEYHDRSAAGIDCSHGSTSTLQVAQGLAVVNSPAGMAFNHNHPMAQKQDHFIPLPRHQDTLQPFAMEEQSMEHMKTLAVNRHGGCSSPVINIGCSSLTTTHIHQNIHPNEIHQRINPTKAGESNHLSMRPTNLQNGLQSMNETNNRSHVMLDESNHTQRGSKKEHRHTVDDAHLHSMNPFVAHKFAIQACQGIIQHNEYSGRSSDQDMQFPHNYKKMRAEMRDNGPKPNMPPPATVRNDNSSVNEVVANQLLTSDTRSSPLCNLLVGKKKPQNRNKNTTNDVQSGSMAAKHNSLVPNIPREVFSCLSDQNVINHKELQAPKSITALGNGRATKERSDRPVKVHDLESLTAATIECHHQPPTPIQPVLTCDSRQVSTTFRRPQAPMETLVENNYEKMTTNGTAKEPVPLATSKSFASANLVNQQEHKADAYICCPSSLKSRVTASSSKHSHSRSLETAPIKHIHNCQSCSNNQQVLGASFPSQVITSQAEPVDNLVQRFENLNINGDSNTNKAEAKSALVPYKGDSKMVPYGGPSYPDKKRHPRPKVDLDQETERVWKLLMWKEGNDDAGMDAKKEKWWEEERRVFRGRADSFIARMHLVQGDRRFSVWKGSVVDSVVGVFLTQNVSDHLSSSAYMALAARFPLKSRSATCNREGSGTSVEVKDVPFPSSKNHKEQMKMPNQRLYTRGFITINEDDGLEEKEIGSCNESFGSNIGVSLENCSEGKCFAAHQIGPKICQESPQNKTDTASTLAGSATLADAEDRKPIEDVFSPQISTISSQNSKDLTFQATDRFGISSNSNYEAEKLINRLECNDLDSSISFMELLQMDGTNMFKEFYMNENGNIPHKENLDGVPNKCDKKKSCIGTEYQIGSLPSISTTSRNHLHAQVENEGMKSIHSDHYYLHIGDISGAEFQNVEVSGEGKRSSLPSTISGITEMRNNFSTGKGINSTTEDKVKFAVDREPFSNAQTTMGGDSCRPTRHQVHPPTSYAKANTHYAAECSSLVDNQTGTVRNVTESSQNYEVHSSKNSSAETIKNDLKGKRRTRAEKNRPFDWDSLRKQTFRNSPERERSSNTMDSVDWEAVRCADIEEIAETIRERGMNHMLSERIKDFLNRLVSEHGSINLEWVRDVPPDKAKDYLLSIRGLGLKSVECVRLLTLHHLAFPVDTNVGRICVRLGWVPLQPLPESLQLHLLEMYPMLETIQKYLWPRLCTLDQRTLYELHYQMITFGKVFCTKNKPNCNACPMRAECKHFASAFASARLALPGPEEKSIVSSVAQITSEHDHRQVVHPMPLPPSEKNPISQRGSGIRRCEPIIEEPATPEPEGFDTSESAIEDAFWTEDPDEIPTIKLNLKELTQNVQNYMLENAELQESDMSKALVALTQKAASIPMPKLKNVSRLRTEHQVYELPDSHPLLAALGRREPDDPSPYLLAIWTPGETAQSIQPPETCCSSQNTGNLCSKKTCFACNSTREAKAQTVRGTFLIPCRTAMKGRFPLNGTYFQVNEVFADNESSVCPIDVPRAWIWNLPRRTVYFGTSVSTIFKGLSTEEIQQCFWRGFVCVRGFDQKIRAPRPLVSRFHFPASKLARTKKTSAELE